MQINSVQNYHTQRPAFKSEVRLHHNDVISINSSLYWKDTIIDGIEQLQKMGIMTAHLLKGTEVLAF